MASAAAPRKRLDVRLVELGLVPSRQRAQALVAAGKVLVNQLPAAKPATLVGRNDDIRLKTPDNPFVSRGGLKLKKALDTFEIDVAGCTGLDVGASTGGFTDCLLQYGARQVYAVDVGYGQLAWKLRQDPRVTLIERTNIRELSVGRIPEPVDLAVIDVSFISLTRVIPAVLKFIRPRISLVALIKPQFEVGRGAVGKGGIVRDAGQHRQVLAEFEAFAAENGLRCLAIIPSPILGAKGNREFLAHLKACGKSSAGATQCFWT